MFLQTFKYFRALSSASPNKLTNPNAMLCGIHALLKNDIRISSSKDDWVFQDMDILKEVRFSLKRKTSVGISSENSKRKIIKKISSWVCLIVIRKM